MNNPKNWIFGLLGVLFIFYIAFQSRFLILGPGITIYSPEDGTVATSSVVTLEGRARNAAWISLNGRQIFTDEKGYFSEKLILSPGQSIMTVSVKDRFGRETEKQVHIILK